MLMLVGPISYLDSEYFGNGEFYASGNTFVDDYFHPREAKLDPLLRGRGWGLQKIIEDNARKFLVWGFCWRELSWVDAITTQQENLSGVTAVLGDLRWVGLVWRLSAGSWRIAVVLVGFFVFVGLPTAVLYNCVCWVIREIDGQGERGWGFRTWAGVLVNLEKAGGLADSGSVELEGLKISTDDRG